jgi:hypothetical protein
MKEMQDKTGYSATEIKKILKQNGCENFKTKPVTDMRAIILGHYSLATSIGDQMKAYNAKLPVPEELACPVPSCEGVKTSVQRLGIGVGKWRCSVGGAKHWIIWRSAVSMSLQYPVRTAEEWMSFLLVKDGTSE